MQKDVYTLKDLSESPVEGNNVHWMACPVIHWDHPLFRGHFPGNAVLPGVVQIQMVTDVISLIFKDEFSLVEAENIKFLNMIVPENTGSLIIDLDIKPADQVSYHVTGTLHNRQLTFLKLKGLFSPAGRLLHSSKS